MWSYHNPDAVEAWAREQRAAREAEAAHHRMLGAVSRQQAGRWARAMHNVGGWMEETGRRLQARYSSHMNALERKETNHAAATRTQPI